MKRHILAVLLLIGAVAYSCTSIEEPLPAAQDGLATAIIEDFVLDGPATKTVVNFDSTNPSFSFTATDILGVFPTSPEQGDQQRFDVKTIEGTVATFNGNGFALKEGQKYAAYYPAVMPAPDVDDIPLDYDGQEQPGKTTFGIAKADYLMAKGIQPSEGVCTFSMQHVGALVVLDVTFPDAGTYTELSLTSDGAGFVKTATLDLTAPSQVNPVSILTTTGTVTLALGENGAGFTVKRKEKVRFCLMVAPKDLSAATLTLALKDSGNDQITMNLDGKNFGKGKAYLYNCAFTPVALTDPTNLSVDANGNNATANTYIVDVDDVNALGYYFDATKAGNGESFTNSYMTNMSCTPQYPTSGNISGAGVKSFWIENSCITDLAYDSENSTITFKATGNKGCAKVTLTSAENGGGSCVWTWLIWCTDAPGDVAYTSYTEEGSAARNWKVMDRNLGALTNGPSSNLREQNGMYYQFGNPVPFTKEEFATFDSGIWRMEDAIALNPNKPFGNGDGLWFNPWGSSNAKNWYGYLWGGWTAGHWGTSYRQMHSSQIPKTKYDPCPVGYQIAPYALFCTGGTHTNYRNDGTPYQEANCLQFSSTSANGLGRYVAGTDDQLFFPCNGCRSGAGGYMWDPDEPNYYIFLWTANHLNSNMAYFYLGGRGGSPSLSADGIWVGRGLGVRCVAEN